MVIFAAVLVALTVAGALAVLATLGTNLRREIDPTRRELGGFGNRVRPALVRVRDTRSELRRRLPRD